MPEFVQSSIERLLHEHLSREDYRPLKQHELARALRLKGGERAAFRRVLYEMERQGRVVRLRKNRWALPDAGRQVTGRLRVHVQGFGFVTPDPPQNGDVYVAEEGMGTALDGDRVVVEVGRRAPSARAPRAYPGAVRATGRIVRVVERRHDVLAGRLRRTRYYGYVIPDNPRIVDNIRVREVAAGADTCAEGHKVVIRLDEWTDPRRPLSGVVIEDLGPAEASGVDILSIQRDHRLDAAFPEEAQREAEQFSPTPPDHELRGRRDLRDLLTLTIDPEDAKDFDDAVSLSRTASGDPVLGVHIADVAHYVRPDSATDREARLRGNSVYLVDRVLTMLPPRLTTDVCSLQPGRDRLTHTVQMTMDAEGGLKHWETFPSVIRSRSRLDYEQVQRLFDGKPGHEVPPEAAAALAEMRPLAAALRAARMREGAIDLRIPEIRCVLDEHGRPVRLVRRGTNEAYQLIEEFMLAANRVVARLIASKAVPSLYRVHGPPDDTQWARMESDLRAMDVAGSVAGREALNRVSRRATGTPAEYMVHLAILRNLRRAEYSSRLDEHFGLAFDCYTHFTSPIRRYPDLVVHRILAAAEDGARPPYSPEEVARIAAHCSQTERNADEAEEESVDVKRIEYFAACLARGENGPHDGLVVSLTPKGLMVELSASLLRGLVPYTSMRDDYYVFDPDRSRAVGRRRRNAWTLGQPVTVRVARVDVFRRLVDFYVSDGDRTGASRTRGKARREPGKRGRKRPRHRMR